MENLDWQKDYPEIVDLSQVDLDTNNSLTKALNLIGRDKRVLEFGCATGYFSQLLVSRGCEVVGLEINEEAAKISEKVCKRVIVADLDFTPLSEILEGETFDVAVFGDVLEHLRQPSKVLSDTRHFLKPDGFVVASVPNIAHGAVRLALLQGKFNYQKYGILDNTHIRFFTRETIQEIFETSGYFLDVIDRTKMPIFSGSELLPRFEKSLLKDEVVRLVETDEESDTLQFIIKACPISDEDRCAVLINKNSELIETLNRVEVELQKTRDEKSLIENSKFWKLRNRLLNFLKIFS
jgi:2-polyprenyl-3-methyl-5-hydroxy-6-metoxy-1,4-benzoquinol methylase